MLLKIKYLRTINLETFKYFYYQISLCVYTYICNIRSDIEYDISDRLL